jgi:hypothetical protein
LNGTTIISSLWKIHFNSFKICVKMLL